MPMKARWIIATAACLALGLLTLPADPWASLESVFAAGSACPANAKLANLNFTLKDLNNKEVKLSSFKGKVILLDFWATWCGPCRVQHPLYQQVMRRFQDNSGVLFLSISTDEEHALVESFVKENHWTNPVYFEDGLASMLRITSIPTTIIVNTRGEISSRMNGFNPDRFVDLLTERIQQAMKD
jgi:thiol-disulfide isomerase/thioredoxin